MSKLYKWVRGDDLNDIADEYEALVRPDGTRVTVVTEPEDRCGYRDLAKVADELNDLKSYSEWLEKELLHYSKERCPKATIENIREVWHGKKGAGL